MATFCPKCYYPLDDDLDDARLCPVCHWFGDKSEVCQTSPVLTSIELTFTQLLKMYRNVCRMELLAEQLSEGRSDPKYARHLVAIEERVLRARHSIIYLFRETQGKK